MPPVRTWTAAPRLATFLLAALVPPHSRADGPARAAVEPAARALLDEVVAAYQGLPAYADHGEIVSTIHVAGKDRTVRSPARVTFARPDRLAVDAGMARLACDGTTLTAVNTPLKTFETRPAPKAVTFDTIFTAGPLGSAVFGGPSGAMLAAVMNLLVGRDPAAAVMELGDTLTLGPDAEDDGAACRVLRLGPSGGTGYRLLIDPKTRLLRAIELVPDAGSVDGLFPAGSKIRSGTYRWSAGAVATTPPDAAAFAFVPPEGYHRLGGPDKDAPPAADETPKFKVQARVGQPAPAFSLTVLDGETTRTVLLKDLAGKVVVLDFWATWCPPCLKELPDVQTLVERYTREKKDVVIVALSQDDDPKDPAAVRKLVESTLEKRKVVLTGGPVGKVAIDPEQTVGQAFDLEGYPTVVVIDAKGVVRGAHVGVSPEIGKVLAAEIDALLKTGK